MTDNIRSKQCQTAGYLRKNPIETNHHPDIYIFNFVNLQGNVTGLENIFLVPEELNFPIDVDQPLRSH